MLLRPRAHTADAGATLTACLHAAISRELLSSVHPGPILALAVAESCRAGETGALLSFDALATADPEADLFQPCAAQALLSLAKENLAALVEIAESKGLSLFYLGMVGGDHLILSDYQQTLIAIPLKELQTQHVQEDS
ncbi:MAG TPA: hypothetical protein VHR86_06190 [Armatimonadota bacterium]|nr:hypothetical protein [Armatimonadota bacterium]